MKAVQSHQGTEIYHIQEVIRGWKTKDREPDATYLILIFEVSWLKHHVTSLK